MKPQLIYRTYIIKLWLTTMLLSPLTFIFLVLIIKSSLFNDPSDPLVLPLFICIAHFFTLPTFLIVAIIAIIFPALMTNVKKIKTLTILLFLAETLFVFLLIYDTDYYNAEQISWGLVMSIIYIVYTLIFGDRYNIERH